MPYKCEKKKIPAQFDRRNKVTPEISEAMRVMYSAGYSFYAISKEFNVHRRTVKRHIIPEYADAEAEKRKRQKVWLKYYDQKQRREYMKSHRHYKRELELAGKLVE